MSERDEKGQAGSAWLVGGVDGMLSVLVRFADTEGLRLSLTVQVGGALITGHLVGIRECLTGMEDMLISVAEPGTGDSLRGMFTRVFDEHPEILKRDLHVPEYIHFKDVTIWTPGGARITEVQVPWWRSRLAAVDGFMLGRIE